MKVELEIPFLIEARIKGSRTKGNHSAFIKEFFEIDEISKSEAPIVAEGFNRRNNASDDDISILRYHDGSFWFPEYKNNKFSTLEQWQVKGSSFGDFIFWNSIITRINKGKNSAKDRVSFKVQEYNKDYFRESKYDSNVVDENRNIIIKGLNENVRLIDGIIYIRVSEPSIIISNDSNYRNSTYVSFNKDFILKTLKANRNFSKPIYADTVTDICNLDKFEDLKDLYDDLGIPIQNIGDNFKNLFSGLYTQDNESKSIIHYAYKLILLKHFNPISLHHDLGIKYYELKKAHYEACENQDENTLELLMKAISDYRSACDNHASTEFSYNKICQITDIAEKRWKQRPISLDFNLNM